MSDSLHYGLRIAVIVTVMIGLAQLFDPWSMVVGMIVVAVAQWTDRRRTA